MGELNRRQFLKASMAAALLPSFTRTTNVASNDDPEYIVVGSGAGGGPLAANLARRGHTVLLLEAGLDDQGQSPVYETPALSVGAAPGDPSQRWDYFVHHYSDQDQANKDSKITPEGVLYPRAATLGGCTGH